MVSNAKTFAAYLEMKKIASFQIEELGDEHQSVIFRSSVVMKGQAVPIGVIIDDSVFTVVRANLVTQALTDENAFAVSSLMTRLNYQNKLFKYYLAPDTSIILDACVPQLKGKFSPELVYRIVEVMVEELKKNYKEFQKILWSD